MTLKSKLRTVLLIMALATLAVLFSACGGGGGNEPEQTTTTAPTGQNQPANGTQNQPTTGVEPVLCAQTFRGIPYDTVGSLTIMAWSGDDAWRPDLGNQNLGPGDLGGAMNVAAIYAVAREFNQMFPNITINLWSQTGSPNRDGIPWVQHRANFYMEHGHYPDIFLVTNLVDEIERGLVADLSIFRDDPRMQVFNQSILEMMTYQDRLFGLPQYVIPVGVWVNRDLANQQNIDIPPINWTWDQYLAFVGHSAHEEFYGSLSPPWNIMNSSTRDIHYQLSTRGPNDPFVNIDTEANRQFVRDVARIVPHAMWNQRNAGNISDEFMAAHGSSGWRFFRQGTSLTLNVSAYMISGAALPGGANEVESPDWDIFPRPSSAHVGNHVGITLDPLALRNFAGENGVLTPEAYQQKLIAWEFATFWLINNQSWEARANQIFYDSNGAPQRALNPSFSYATGETFDRQMEIWGSVPARARFLDANLMPGWQRVMELFEQGEFWEVAQQTFPWTFEFEGGSRAIGHEWWNRHTYAVTGAAEHEPQWVDLALSLMPEWDRVINERWAEAFERLYAAIDRFYPALTRPSN